MRTDCKIKIAGNHVGVLKYGMEINYGSLSQKRPVRFRAKSKFGVRTKTSLYRAKSHLKWLINANAWEWFDEKKGKVFIPIFLTLTFKDNVRDIKLANREYSKFIQRFNYEMGYKKSYLKYSVAIQFQDRGAVHYHMVFFNLPYVKDLKNKLLKIWGKGFTNFRKIKNVRNVGNYMTKYMAKDVNDKRLYGQKCYFGSRGLKKPFVSNDKKLIDFIYALGFLPDSGKVFDKTFKSDFCETINSREYDLTKEQEKRKAILALFAMVK